MCNFGCFEVVAYSWLLCQVFLYHHALMRVQCNSCHSHITTVCVFSEFIAIAKANPLSLSLKSVFGELDVDGDGYITRSEMRQAFDKMGHSLSDDEINAIFRQCDVNQDGKINFDGKDNRKLSKEQHLLMN